MSNAVLKWEDLTLYEGPYGSRVGPQTERMAVPGGWIYRVQNYGTSEYSLVFVPAPSFLSRLLGWRRP